MTEDDEGHPRILVVEDDPAIRGLITAVALKADLDVSEASNGAEAARLLRQRKFAVITLDLMMPTLSGYELLDQLEKDGCESCVILITAASDNDLEAIDQSFIFDVIRKPFDIGDIREALLRAVDDRRKTSTRLSVRREAKAERLAKRETPEEDVTAPEADRRG